MDYVIMPVAWALAGFRHALSPLSGADTGLTWLLAILLVAVLVRVALLPLNVRQFHTQVLSRKANPELKAITGKYHLLQKEMMKSDLSEQEKMQQRRTLQLAQLQEVKTVQANYGLRFRGALIPLIVQVFVGIGVFQVLRALQSGTESRFGLDAETISSAANATFLDNPVSGALLTFSDGLYPGGVPESLWVLPALVLFVALVSTLSVRLSFQRSYLTSVHLGQETKPPGRFQKIALLLVVPVFVCTYALLPLGLLVNIAAVLLVTLIFQIVMVKRHLSPSLQTT